MGDLQTVASACPHWCHVLPSLHEGLVVRCNRRAPTGARIDNPLLSCLPLMTFDSSSPFDSRAIGHKQCPGTFPIPKVPSQLDCTSGESLNPRDREPEVCRQQCRAKPARPWTYEAYRRVFSQMRLPLCPAELAPRQNASPWKSSGATRAM